MQGVGSARASAHAPDTAGRRPGAKSRVDAVAGSAEVVGREPRPVGPRTTTTAGTRKRRDIRRALVVSDVIAFALAFVIVLLVSRSLPDGSRWSATEELLVFGASLPLLIGLAKMYGLYERDETTVDHSTVDDIFRVVQAVTIGVWFVGAITALTNVAGPTTLRLVGFWALAVGTVPAARALTRLLLRRDATYVQHAVIVGAGSVASSLARKLGASHTGIEVIGFVDRDPMRELLSEDDPPLLGLPEDLPFLVKTMQVDRVIVAFSGDSHEETLELLRSLADMGVRVDIVPRLFEIIGANVRVHSIGGLPLLGLPSLQLSRGARAVKRGLDLMVATIGLLMLSPLFLVIAVVLRVDSRGPVFFRQVRRGEGERTFEILKFRTMTADAEERKAQVKHLNIHSDGDARMFKAANDPRITRVGAFLRRYSIDELPQLWNVIRGDMSLVGPRPLILEEDQYVHSWARKRLSLKPGITGLWQVLGRSDIPFDEMVKLDYLYVSNWSVGEDLRLIGLTLPALFRGRRAL